jgi:hypothetical protein
MRKLPKKNERHACLYPLEVAVGDDGDEPTLKSQGEES